MQSQHACLCSCDQRRVFKCGARLLCTPKLARLHSPLGAVPCLASNSFLLVAHSVIRHLSGPEQACRRPGRASTGNTLCHLTLGRLRTGMPPTWARKPGADNYTLSHLTLGRPWTGMPPTWARKPGADAASLAALLDRNDTLLNCMSLYENHAAPDRHAADLGAQARRGCGVAGGAAGARVWQRRGAGGGAHVAAQVPLVPSRWLQAPAVLRLLVAHQVCGLIVGLEPCMWRFSAAQLHAEM